MLDGDKHRLAAKLQEEVNKRKGDLAQRAPVMTLISDFRAVLRLVAADGIVLQISRSLKYRCASAAFSRADKADENGPKIIAGPDSAATREAQFGT
jgi:hypothetical protein